VKAESLFHLLQIRARKLEEGGDTPTVQKLRALQAELRVSHTRGWFEVTWRHEGRDFSLNVPEHDFTFYVAGDTDKAVEHRGTTGNVRQRNWRAAADLWRRLAEISGFRIAPDVNDDAMGLVPKAAKAPTFRARQVLTALSVALIGTVAGVLHAGWEIGLACGLIALLFAALAPGLEDTQLRRPFSPPETAILAAGAFTPAWLGGDPFWLMPALAGLVLMAWLENSEIDLPFAWGVGGALVGGASFWLGIPAVLPVFALSGGLLALRFLAPRRLAAADVAWSLAGGVVGLGAGIVARSAAVDTDVGPAAPLAICIVLLLAFGLWSFHGMLFRLLPWLAIGTLGVAAAAAIIGGTSAIGGVLALGGFAAVIAARLVIAFARASTPRRSMPLKD